MWGSGGQDLPTFWQCGGPYVLGPPTFTAVQRLRTGCGLTSYSYWSCYVTIWIIISSGTTLRPASLHARSIEQESGTGWCQVTFSPAHASVPQLLLVLPPYHGSLFTRVAAPGGEHQHSPVRRLSVSFTGRIVSATTSGGSKVVKLNYFSTKML